MARNRKYKLPIWLNCSKAIFGTAFHEVYLEVQIALERNCSERGCFVLGGRLLFNRKSYFTIPSSKAANTVVAFGKISSVCFGSTASVVFFVSEFIDSLSITDQVLLSDINFYVIFLKSIARA